MDKNKAEINKCKYLNIMYVILIPTPIMYILINSYMHTIALRLNENVFSIASLECL